MIAAPVFAFIFGLVLGAVIAAGWTLRNNKNDNP